MIPRLRRRWRAQALPPPRPQQTWLRVPAERGSCDAAAALPGLPSGVIAKISTLSCLSCKNFWVASSCAASRFAKGTAVFAARNRCECNSLRPGRRILHRRERHVAVRASLRLRRIVKRARTEPGDAAGLPIVVIIEAANPAIVIHGNIEMHFVAGRTKIRGLRAHERFQKSAPMRLGIQFHQKIMDARAPRDSCSWPIRAARASPTGNRPGPSCFSRP